MGVAVAVKSTHSERRTIERKLARLHEGHAPRVLDLFCGCGGLSLGFQRAGFEIVAGIDNDPDAAASHSVNIHGAPVPANHEEKVRYARDLTRLEPEDLLGESGFDKGSITEAIDVLVGGPPCQSYARVGRAKLREVAAHARAFKVDPRGNLYLRYLHYVRALKPLVLVMENVPDVLNCGGHNIAEEITEVLEKEGYDCAYTLLNTVFYGIPQMRERMILIACHASLEADINFPAPGNGYELPPGYLGSRNVALKQLLLGEGRTGRTHYVDPPKPQGIRSRAVTARQALADLPRITGHLSGAIRRGVRRLDGKVTYASKPRSAFARLMRTWPDFESSHEVDAHVIRALPRDYKIFKRMKPGDQYPEAHALALELFMTHVENIRGTRWEVDPDSDEFEALRKRFVPPYDPRKFPNKWRKMEPDQPARTVMAHLGKDSYSHIHYDSTQARTISVREAARLQSFPDGFIFVGAMNAAFRQIGNAVPPLLAWKIGEQLMEDVFRPISRQMTADGEEHLTFRPALVEPVQQT